MNQSKDWKELQEQIAQIIQSTGVDYDPDYVKELEEMFDINLDELNSDFTENYEFSKYINDSNRRCFNGFIKTIDDNWLRENYQRECAQIAINTLNLNDNDIIITTDCDEIPKRSLIESIKNNTYNIYDGVYSIEMTLYYYNIELTSKNKWKHAKLLNYKTYKTFNLITDIRFATYKLIKNAGYHLSYFGDTNFIINKLESFAEQQENTNDNKNVDYLNNCIKNGTLFFNKTPLVHISLKDNNNVPLYFKS
jgi:hypothetical protein